MEDPEKTKETLAAELNDQEKHLSEKTPKRKAKAKPSESEPNVSTDPYPTNFTRPWLIEEE